jgi:DNA-binding NarL/FixJ family response regulator
MPPLVKLLVLHSQPLFCDQFFELFKKANGIKEIHRATTAADARELLNTIKLNLLFIYDMLEDTEISQFIRNVKVNFADMAIVLYTMSREMSYMKKMKKLGVKGFVHTSADRKIIKRVIDAVAEGNFNYCPVFSNLIGDNDKEEDVKVTDVKAFFGFTEKEWEVFKWKVNRKSLNDIAEHMGWVYDTAKDYSSKVLKKVQAKEYKDVMDYVWKTGYSVEI